MLKALDLITASKQRGGGGLVGGQERVKCGSSRVALILSWKFPYGPQTQGRINKKAFTPTHIVVKCRQREKSQSSEREKYRLLTREQHLFGILVNSKNGCRVWNNISKMQRENNWCSRFLYPAKLSFKNEDKNKNIPDKLQVRVYWYSLEELLEGTHKDEENSLQKEHLKS